MEACERRILRANYVELVRNLDPEDVLDYLYQERVLSADDCETIRADATRAQRTRRLLNVLPNKSRGSYLKFVEALTMAGLEFLVEKLKSTTVEDFSPTPTLESPPQIPVSFYVHPPLSDITSHVKLPDLMEKLKQQSEVVAAMQAEMSKLQEDLKRTSQNYDGNEKFRQTVCVLGELEKEKEEQKEILDDVYEAMLKEINQEKERMDEQELKRPRQSTIESVASQNSIKPTKSYKSYSKIKCVLVGDGATGKTSIVHYFISKTKLITYVPTVFENRALDVPFGSTLVNVQFWDTAGQEEYDRLRPLCYSDSDVALLVFSIDSQQSLQNVLDKWQPELKHYCPKVPIILVGNKTDVIQDPAHDFSVQKDVGRPVEAKEANKAAEVLRAVGKKAFLCSAHSGEGIDDLLHHTVESALYAKQRRSRQKAKCFCM